MWARSWRRFKRRRDRDRIIGTVRTRTYLRSRRIEFLVDLISSQNYCSYYQEDCNSLIHEDMACKEDRDMGQVRDKDEDRDRAEEL